MTFGEWYLFEMPKLLYRAVRYIFIICGYFVMIPFLVLGAIIATFTIAYVAAYRATYEYWGSSPLDKTK